MKVCDRLSCDGFPCLDVVKGSCTVPGVDVDPAKVRVLMISEAPPVNPADGFYAGSNASHFCTTAEAFAGAGAPVASMPEILDLGVYLTTAIKCPKTGYGVSTKTIQSCSAILAREMALFPGVRAYLLMGDVAIKAMNQVAWAAGGPRVIPAMPTYKIRKGVFTYKGARVFPSYLQTGKSLLIEMGKLSVISEDIRAALSAAS